jgi:hypothetical protein
VTDQEINRAVAEARGQITGHTAVGDIPPRLPDVCTDPAAWGALLEELAAQNTTPSLHRGPSLAHNTVVWFAVVYNKFGTHQTASDPLPGRALALAFLKAVAS